MEELLLAFRSEVEEPLTATCGKVGGIGEYGKYFSLLTQELFSIISEERAKSSYHFAHLGEVSFIKDADAQDPAVMLASLLGKYMRELTMKRIARYYLSQSSELLREPSGYHDPVSNAFVVATERLRLGQGIPLTCFERTRDPKPDSKKTSKKTRAANRGTRVQKTVKPKASKKQASLF